MAKIDSDYNSKVFFKLTKRMTGNLTNASPYRPHNYQKFFDVNRQEPIFRDFWIDIFRADDPDENDFDNEFIEDVERRLYDKTHLITPHNNSDLHRFDNTNCPPITLTEVTDIIKAMKHKAPGPNRLTAHQLKSLPDNMKRRLTDILTLPFPLVTSPTLTRTRL